MLLEFLQFTVEMTAVSDVLRKIADNSVQSTPVDTAIVV